MSLTQIEFWPPPFIINFEKKNKHKFSRDFNLNYEQTVPPQEDEPVEQEALRDPGRQRPRAASTHDKSVSNRAANREEEEKLPHHHHKIPPSRRAKNREFEMGKQWWGWGEKRRERAKPGAEGDDAVEARGLEEAGEPEHGRRLRLRRKRLHGRRKKKLSFRFSFLFSFCLRGRIAMIGCVYYYETRKKAYLSLMRQRVRKADLFSRRL